MSKDPSKPFPKRSRLAIIHPDTVRVPRSLARVTLPIVTKPQIVDGAVIVEVQVRAEHVLRAIAALGRRDNITRRMVWRNQEMNTRVGVTTKKAGANTVHLLHQVGVIESYSRKSAGMPYTVTLARVEDTESLQLPLAALWEHQWATGHVTGPRYDKQTAVVARVLLALIAYGTWSDGYTRVVWKRSNAFMTKRLGLGKGTWEDWWRIFQEAVKGDAWITIEKTTDPWGGHGPYRVTVDWTRLPILAAAPALPGESASVGEPEDRPEPESEVVSPDRGEGDSPERGEVGSPERVGQLHRDLKKDSAFQAVLSEAVPSSQPRAHTEGHPDTTGKGEAERDPNGKVEDLRVQDVLRNGLDSPHAGDPQADNSTASYEAWLLTVVAVLVDANTPNRLGLSRPNVRTLREGLRDRYEAGWVVSRLAAEITRQAPPDSVRAVLDGRIAEIPEEPNYVGVATSPQALADTRAYDELASCRSAEKYTQQHL